MEKSCHVSTSADNTNPNPNTNTTSCNTNASAATSTSSSTLHQNNSIRMLNKSSHKITKHHHYQNHGPIIVNQQETPNPPAAPPSSPPSSSSSQPAPIGPPQPQPPVYNINKNDFRDVVQKLTGSHAHHQLNPRIPAPPAVTSPHPPPPTTEKPSPSTTTSSRLHKIRPPPLAHLNPRPNPTVTAGGGGNMWTRVPMVMPSSPLPPLPTVSAAAESPITAYMRRLNGGGIGQQQSLMMAPGSLGAPLFPLLTAFGCMPSPGSAYQLTLPPSPRLPMPSPDAPKDQGLMVGEGADKRNLCSSKPSSCG